jgi:hypothetical protein
MARPPRVPSRYTYVIDPGFASLNGLRIRDTISPNAITDKINVKVVKLRKLKILNLGKKNPNLLKSSIITIIIMLQIPRVISTYLNNIASVLKDCTVCILFILVIVILDSFEDLRNNTTYIIEKIISKMYINIMRTAINVLYFINILCGKKLGIVSIINVKIKRKIKIILIFFFTNIFNLI